MNRRDLFFIVMAAAASACIGAPASADTIPADAFLRGVYEREVERHNRRLPPDNDRFYQLFTREMRALMQAPARPDPSVPLGPVLHALFGRGALPGREVGLREVAPIRQDADMAMVSVALTVSGHAREVVVVMLRQDVAWRIHNIEYGPADTLAAHHRRVTGR